MRYAMSLLLVGLLAAIAGAAPSMKTHSTQAPGAKVTVVHFGAPW